MTEVAFQTVAPYWPPGVAMYWWEHPEVDVRGDFEAARAAGIECLAVDLMWNDFQPDHDRVAVSSMRHLEQVLEDAEDYHIRVRLTFFPITIGPLLWLPGWALRAGTQGSGRVISGHHLSSMVPYNLSSDGRMVEAQQRLVREVVSAFADHPAVSGWVLGRGLSAASPPPDAGGFGSWIDTLASTARQAGATQQLSHGIATRDLICMGALAPELATGTGVALEVVDDWVPDWSDLPRVRWSGFLAAYARALCGSPVSIGGLGGDASRSGIPSGSSGEEADVAEAIEAGLDAIFASGGSGAAVRALMDYSHDLAHSPPFREDPALLRSGLMTSEGLPKEPLAPWAAWSRSSRTVHPALDLPFPDPEERHRDPEAVAREFYGVYTA